MILIESVEIGTEDIDYLQFLQFEVDSYSAILERILINKNPKYEFSKDNYQHFMNEYKQARMKIGITSNEVLKKYGLEKYLGNSDYYYNFDFGYHLCQIYQLEPSDKNKGCGHCGN